MATQPESRRDASEPEPKDARHDEERMTEPVEGIAIGRPEDDLPNLTPDAVGLEDPRDMTMRAEQPIRPGGRTNPSQNQSGGRTGREADVGRRGSNTENARERLASTDSHAQIDDHVEDDAPGYTQPDDGPRDPHDDRVSPQGPPPQRKTHGLRGDEPDEFDRVDRWES